MKLSISNVLTGGKDHRQPRFIFSCSLIASVIARPVDRCCDASRYAREGKINSACG